MLPVGEHLADAHLLEEHELSQVLLAVDDDAVLAEILADVAFAGLHSAVARELPMRVDARFRLDDLLRDLAVLRLVERDLPLAVDRWQSQRPH